MSLEAERAVLGSILKQPSLIDECYLTAADFIADERHGLILTTLKYAAEKFDGSPDPFDPVMMATHWGANLAKIGGNSYLTQLRTSQPSTSLFGEYQQVIRAAYVQREQNQLFEAAAAGSMNISEIKERLAELESLERGKDVTGPVKIYDLMADHHREIMARGSRPGLTGAKTASSELDEMGSGHQPGDLIYIAARPSIGKTAYIVNDSIAVASGGSTAVIFSAEMPAMDVSERHICAIAGIDSKKIRTGRLTENDWDSYSKALEILERLPIYIDDTPYMTLEYIKRQIKALKQRYPRLVVYIDYLQLIGTEKSFKNTSERVSYVSSELKQIARAYEIPIICISSVGRKCEDRQDKRPLMSDLRDSGNIEFDADIVIFLYRDDYYYPDTVLKGIIELIVAKGRKIGTGTIQMFFNRKNGRFTDLTQDDKYELEKKVREHGKTNHR